MVKLKLSAMPDDRPVKLTVELPGAVYRDLVAYAEVFAQEHGQRIDPAKLVPSMLAGSCRPTAHLSAPGVQRVVPVEFIYRHRSRRYAPCAINEGCVLSGALRRPQDVIQRRASCSRQRRRSAPISARRSE
jgi:hypothetical protein